MGLNVQCGQITAPGATGVQTYSLPADFDPKALLLTMTYQSSNAVQAGDCRMTFGWGTYDASTVQQYCWFTYGNDGLGTSDTVRGSFSASILNGNDDTTALTTSDFEVDLDSFVTGASSSFKLNWVDLPATGSLLVNYLVIGGSDVLKARAGVFTMSTAAATQDITVAASWGQPDAVLFASHGWTDSSGAMTNGHTRAQLGWATDSAARVASYAQQDAAATMLVGTYQGSNLGYMFGSTPVADAAFTLTASKASWPTDGFQLAYNDQASFAFINQAYLAIKFQNGAGVDIGNFSTPTAAAPQTSTITSSGTPKGVLFAGTYSTGGLVTSGADCGGLFIGASDGTNEGAAGIWETDANTTAISSRFISATKSIQQIVSDASLQSEADTAFSGSNVNVTWNDTDTTARVVNYMVFYEAAAATPVIPPRSVAVLQGVNRAAVI